MTRVRLVGWIITLVTGAVLAASGYALLSLVRAGELGSYYVRSHLGLDLAGLLVWLTGFAAGVTMLRRRPIARLLLRAFGGALGGLVVVHGMLRLWALPRIDSAEAPIRWWLVVPLVIAVMGIGMALGLILIRAARSLDKG